MNIDVPQEFLNEDLQGQIRLLLASCKGNESAVDWLVRYNTYVHALDDLVDDDYHREFDDIAQGRRKKAMDVAVQALEVHSHPFYQQNIAQLYRLLRVAHINYEDSVAFERSPVEWQRAESDVIRHGASDVARAVVDICGGLDEARKISLIVRSVCYQKHHDKDGKPI
jgi:hypothetical protein